MNRMLLMAGLVCLTACSDEGVYRDLQKCNAAVGKQAERASRIGMRTPATDTMGAIYTGAVITAGRTLGKSDQQIADDMNKEWDAAPAEGTSKGYITSDQCRALLHLDPQLLERQAS